MAIDKDTVKVVAVLLAFAWANNETDGALANGIRGGLTTVAGVSEAVIGSEGPGPTAAAPAATPNNAAAVTEGFTAGIANERLARECIPDEFVFGIQGACEQYRAQNGTAAPAPEVQQGGVQQAPADQTQAFPETTPVPEIAGVPSNATLADAQNAADVFNGTVGFFQGDLGYTLGEIPMSIGFSGNDVIVVSEDKNASLSDIRNSLINRLNDSPNETVRVGFEDLVRATGILIAYEQSNPDVQVVVANTLVPPRNGVTPGR